MATEESSFTRAWSHFTVAVGLTPCACLAAQSTIVETVTSADFSIQRKKKIYILSVNQKRDILSVQSTLSTEGELWRTCFIEVSLAARVEGQGLEINSRCWVTASEFTWEMNRRNILELKKSITENYKWHMSTPLEAEPLFLLAVSNYVRKFPPSLFHWHSFSTHQPWWISSGYFCNFLC